MTIARRTSRHWTLPDPSQIELRGLSRKRRGIPDSSTYPLPPRHSRHSTACIGRPLADPVLEHRIGDPLEALAPPRRRRSTRRRSGPGAWPRSSPPPTRRRGRRARCASAAARSAPCRTTERCAAWWIACATPARIPVALPIAQSSLVWLTISMIVRTPHPPRRPARPRRRRTRSRWRRWSGCRACPSGAAGGSGCARRPASSAGRGSRRCRRRPGRGRGRRRTSAPT